MDAKVLENAMERAERALMRIERSVERGAMAPARSGQDGALRAKVADALAELDEIIREAAL